MVFSCKEAALERLRINIGKAIIRLTVTLPVPVIRSSEYPKSAYFSYSDIVPAWVHDLTSLFVKEEVRLLIDTERGLLRKGTDSDYVLGILRNHLEAVGFEVEQGKHSDQKISLRIQSGDDCLETITWDMDAMDEKEGIYLEVEKGRAVDNWHIYRDLVRVCVIPGAKYAVIVLPIKNDPYKPPFDTAVRDFGPVFCSRFKLPLEGLLLIGY